jgi:hypothetical protein
MTVAVIDDADHERVLAVPHTLQPTIHDSVPVRPGSGAPGVLP